METEIISNERFAADRAANALTKMSTKLGWAYTWVLLVIRLQEQPDSRQKWRKLIAAAGYKPEDDGMLLERVAQEWARDVKRFQDLMNRLIMLSHGLDPKKRTPPKRLKPWRPAPSDPNVKWTEEDIRKHHEWNLANAVRGPKPGEFDEIVREAESLFENVTPPPKFPSGGGQRKVA
jgi:hypothetical protein